MTDNRNLGQSWEKMKYNMLSVETRLRLSEMVQEYAKLNEELLKMEPTSSYEESRKIVSIISKNIANMQELINLAKSC